MYIVRKEEQKRTFLEWCKLFKHKHTWFEWTSTSAILVHDKNRFIR
jgi:hypothetical protein